MAAVQATPTEGPGETDADRDDERLQGAASLHVDGEP
jgi:hypothetical protein